MKTFPLPCTYRVIACEIYSTSGSCAAIWSMDRMVPIHRRILFRKNLTRSRT